MSESSESEETMLKEFMNEMEKAQENWAKAQAEIENYRFEGVSAFCTPRNEKLVFGALGCVCVELDTDECGRWRFTESPAPLSGLTVVHGEG
ncbi:MAG: hypothetical protein P8144_14325 [Gammaproteobacteria bacterium]